MLKLHIVAPTAAALTVHLTAMLVIKSLEVCCKYT